MRSLLIIFIIVVFDQATKFIVQSSFALGEGFNVISGFFDIRYVQNTGAAFGILEGFNVWLVVLSLFMIAFLVGFRRLLFSNMKFGIVVYSLLVAGIIGNLIDRIKYGYVIDFLYFYWRGHDFPAFNVADSAISIGACAYIILQKFVKASETTAVSAKIEEKTSSD